jgi:hypothetical protein
MTDLKMREGPFAEAGHDTESTSVEVVRQELNSLKMSLDEKIIPLIDSRLAIVMEDWGQKLDAFMAEMKREMLDTKISISNLSNGATTEPVSRRAVLSVSYVSGPVKPSRCITRSRLTRFLTASCWRCTCEGYGRDKRNECGKGN